MNHMRTSTIRALVALSFALCALAFVPSLTFAAPNCNLQRNLVKADLSGCNLSSADLSSADLSSANLTDANLTDADFTDADLTDALRRPGISRADMDGVKGLDKVKGLID